MFYYQLLNDAMQALTWRMENAGKKRKANN